MSLDPDGASICLQERGKERGIMDGSNSSFSRRKHIRLKLGASSSQIFSEPLSSRCTQLSRAATAIRVNMG